MEAVLGAHRTQPLESSVLQSLWSSVAGRGVRIDVIGVKIGQQLHTQDARLTRLIVAKVQHNHCSPTLETTLWIYKVIQSAANLWTLAPSNLYNLWPLLVCILGSACLEPNALHIPCSNRLVDIVFIIA